MKLTNWFAFFAASVSSLKQLNKTILLKFLQLTKVLVQSPSEYEEKVRELKAALMNFQHLLNLYRPHEARETIITMLERQLERRKAVLELLKERIAAADDKVAEAKSRLSKQLSRLDNEELPPPPVLQPQNIDSNGHVTQNDTTSESTTQLLDPVDALNGLNFLGPYLDSL